MHISLKIKLAGFVLRFFPLLIYSAILRIDFLCPFINLMLILLPSFIKF